MAVRDRITRQLDETLHRRREAAVREQARTHAREMRDHAARMLGRRDVVIEDTIEGRLVTITAPTEGIVLMRMMGACCVVAMTILVTIADAWSPASMAVAAVLGALAAASWRRWPFRIRIAGRAYAIEGWRRDRFRYVAPIDELYLWIKFGDYLDVSADRRIGFYGVRHPEDQAAIRKLQRELDAVRKC